MSKCAQYDPLCDCPACADDRYQAIKAHNGFCRICNAKRGAGGCTNGLCAECHGSCCTDGGATYPGHYIDRDRQNARPARLTWVEREPFASTSAKDSKG